jgi:hypothetical protein
MVAAGSVTAAATITDTAAAAGTVADMLALTVAAELPDAVA